MKSLPTETRLKSDRPEKKRNIGADEPKNRTRDWHCAKRLKRKPDPEAGAALKCLQAETHWKSGQPGKKRDADTDELRRRTRCLDAGKDVLNENTGGNSLSAVLAFAFAVAFSAQGPTSL
ncbi:MAG: hypothetical protein M0Q15_03550 [Nevskia sp.]|nr:hypothetical protein [Nevskia sp.]